VLGEADGGRGQRSVVLRPVIANAATQVPACTITLPILSASHGKFSKRILRNDDIIVCSYSGRTIT
jgi:hypothetical protein